MAIYYINPHTTTNGDGSFASPWSLNSTTRTGLASGDEIRILGVALTSLLTATSYTATVSNNYQLTITAGGGLGADWVLGDVAYLPAYDTFFKVYSVSGNVIQAYTSSSSMLPINNSSATSVTVRKVNTTSYPVSVTAGFFTITSGISVDNISVSDCWTDATTRVTDGTVKTLLNTSSSGAMTFTTNNLVCSNWTVNLQNTAIMCARATSTSVVTCQLNATTSTYNIGQVFSAGGNTALGIYLGSNTLPNDSSTVNITHYSGYTVFNQNSLYGQNNTVSITNCITYYSDYMFSSVGFIAAPNNTVNIANLVAYSSTFGNLFNFNGNNLGCPKFDINVTNSIDFHLNTAPNVLITGFGHVNVTIESSVIFYYNKRANTATSFTSGVSNTASSFSTALLYVPTYSVPSGWTITNKYNITASYLASSVGTRNIVPVTVNMVYPENSGIATNTPNGCTSVNTLITFEDGSAPYEILGVTGPALTSISPWSCPKVTTDSTVYKTTGPSLKSFLNTRSTTIWLTRFFRARKTIKIPCTASTSYTVAGFIRTDDTSYVNGDCRVSIYLNDVEIVGQDMTTACENAWEGFSLNFTAGQTGEYVLVWSMYYANGNKSYWLDDLTIS